MSRTFSQFLRNYISESVTKSYWRSPLDHLCYPRVWRRVPTKLKVSGETCPAISVRGPCVPTKICMLGPPCPQNQAARSGTPCPHDFCSPPVSPQNQAAGSGPPCSHNICSGPPCPHKIKVSARGPVSQKLSCVLGVPVSPLEPAAWLWGHGGPEH